MARKLRLEYAGACYHVINRGNHRRDLFQEAGAAQSFVVCVLEGAERFSWRLHAYVVMSNHFHLAVETPEPNLSDGMKWLQGTWARRFNEFRTERGRPFQGRYKALHVEAGHSLAQVAHYIHLNPVRANLLPVERVLDYPWSSLPRFLAKERPKALEAGVVLRESGGLSDTQAGWRRYVQYLALLDEEDQGRREERYGRLSRGWVIGSETFTEAMRAEYSAVGRSERTLALAGADRTAHRQMRAILWEDTLQALAAGWKIALNQLPTQRSAEEKVRLATAMKLATSVSNGWLAERLQMGDPASVSQYVRRFRLAGLDREPEFQRLLSRVKA